MKFSNFDASLKTLLLHEGGYSHHKKDPGGATKYGISLRFLRKQQIVSGDLDKDGDIDADDVKNLAFKEAALLYREEFWDKMGLEKIEDLRLASMIFGLSVNMGPKAALMLLGKAMDRSGTPISIPPKLSSSELTLINSLSPSSLLLAYKIEACHYYRSLAVKNKNLEGFLKGWIKRANSY